MGCPHRGQPVRARVGGEARVLDCAGTAPGVESSQADGGRGGGSARDPGCPGGTRAGAGALLSRTAASWDLTALPGGGRRRAAGRAPPAAGVRSHENKAAETSKSLNFPLVMGIMRFG